MAPPWFERAPASREPRIGPVQEKDTMARVRAMKNMPGRLVPPDLLFTELATLPGRVISKYPKKEIAKTTKITKKVRFSQTLVEILFKISGSVWSSRWNGRLSST